MVERSQQNKDVLHENRQQSIVSGITATNQKDIELTRTKFGTAYFIAKEEMPLKKSTPTY